MPTAPATTVRRNTKLGQRVLTAPAQVHAYNLGNGFSGADVEVERFVTTMTNDIAGGMTPTIRSTHREGWYQVQFHSNRWYEVRLEVG